MEKELQADLKLVAEKDGWNILPNGNVSNPAWRDKFQTTLDEWKPEILQYHTSWEWQIPVWAKLWREGKATKAEHRDYFKAASDDNPRAGFDIIVSIIKRIKQ